MHSILINDKFVAEVILADNCVTRICGLLGYKNLPENKVMILKGAKSIHTCFMRFALDVFYVNKNNKVIGAYKNVNPFRILPMHLTSSYVIEAKAGCIDIKKGDIIKVVK